MEQSKPPPYVQMRIIALAMVIGVVLFWIVAVVMLKVGVAGQAADAFPPNVPLLIWAVLALGGFGGALSFRSRAVEAAEKGRREGNAEGSAGQVASALIIAWALMEGPALLSSIFVILTGDVQVLWGAVPVFLLGMAMTAPNSEWFGHGR